MYQARITRQNPAAFIILVDQSGSMASEVTVGMRVTTRSQIVAEAVNMMLAEIIYRCKRDDGVRDYFDIAVVGYNANGVRSLLDDRHMFIKPAHLEALRVPMGAIAMERTLPSGEVILTTRRVPEWVKAEHFGATPMAEALEYVYTMTNKWCRKKENRDSYPPTIINITDGDNNDSSHDRIRKVASKIKSLSTSDGNALLINIHVSASEYSSKVIFPSHPSQLPVLKEAQTLFDISSVMPEVYRAKIATLTARPDDEYPYRGLCFNASLNELLSMINIGSVCLNFII